MTSANSPDHSNTDRCPAYRIESERTVVRCWHPNDAESLLQAISQSIDHLKAWMPWAANEPSTPEEKIALLRRWRAAFDLDEDYVYGIFSPDESEVWGGTGLHKRVAGSAPGNRVLDSRRLDKQGVGDRDFSCPHQGSLRLT